MIPKYLVRCVRRGLSAQPGQSEPCVALVRSRSSDATVSYTSYAVPRSVWGPADYGERPTDGVMTNVLPSRDVEVWRVDLEECAAGPAVSIPGVAAPATPGAAGACPVPQPGDLLQRTSDGTFHVVQPVKRESREEVFTVSVKQRP